MKGVYVSRLPHQFWLGDRPPRPGLPPPTPLRLWGCRGGVSHVREGAMPIGPYLAGERLDPETTRSLGVAFEMIGIGEFIRILRRIYCSRA